MLRKTPLSISASRTSGFTLIELLVVIFIIAVVAAAALYALNPAKRIGESNDGRRNSDLISLGKALELYTADYGSAPSQLASSGIAAGQKYVLCSSAAELSCAGQTNDCLVVTDTNFLGQYLPSLPIDPTKSAVTDTGYYITRSNTNSLVLGACSSYNTSAPIQVTSRVNLPAYAGPTSQGPLSPSSGTTDSSIGTYNWSNPTNIYTSNYSWADVGSFGVGGDKISYYLVASGFNFSIPSGATINGIVVEVEKQGSDGTSYDQAVRIIKGGVIGSTDKSSASEWPALKAYSSYGSSADLWGTTWTYSDINAANFGVALSLHSASYAWAAIIDHVRVTVYYTP